MKLAASESRAIWLNKLLISELNFTEFFFFLASFIIIFLYVLCVLCEEKYFATIFSDIKLRNRVTKIFLQVDFFLNIVYLEEETLLHRLKITGIKTS